MRPPATIVVGEVVALRDRFNWFEKLPLFGKRIVITRDRGQAVELAAALNELGAEAILLPTIEIRPPEDPEPLDHAIARLRTYDWLIFTSVNGVRFFIERLDASARDMRALSSLKICAIGPATRAAVEALHLKVDLMPRGICRGKSGGGVYGGASERTANPAASRGRGSRRGAEGTDATRRERRRRGGVSHDRTRGLAEHVAEVFARKMDWITFGSSSAVQNLVEAAGPAALLGVSHSVRIASIGPVTSQTVRDCGLQVDAEAKPYTMEGLIAAIVHAEDKSAAPK